MANNSKRHHFPCTRCGSQLAFEPGTNHLLCDHCHHTQEIRVSREPILEYDYYAQLNELPEAAPDAVRFTIDCEACGAETDFDRNIHADECPFCGTEFVLDSHQHRLIPAKSMLPFRITADQARKQYKAWLKRLWFTPNALKKYARQDQELNGVYVPYWTYDCDTTSDYRGERGDVYYVRHNVRVNINGRWVTRQQMVPKIRWSPARGQVHNHFNDTLVYASDTLPREITRKLKPWDLPHLTPYQEEFIAGFRSEVYQTDLNDGFEIARKRIHPALLSSIRHDIGGDQQRIHQLDTQYRHVRFKHLLLPFWIAGFRFRKKTFQFIINGRTGEVQGDRPYSRWKLFFASLGLVGLVILFMVVASQSQGA